MRKISITNQKGGVGKTTTAVNLAYALSELGQHVLLADVDPQSNATMACLGDREPGFTVYDLLTGTESANTVILKLKDNLEFIPSDLTLASADIEFAQELGREAKLRRVIAALKGYDFILFDTPPSLGLLSVNALLAADEVFIPVSMSFWAMKGIEQLERTIGLIQINLSHRELRISGVIGTFYEKVTRVSQDVLEIIRDYFGDLMFETVIPKNVRLEEANARGLSIFQYDPASPGAQAYMALAEEVLSRG